MNDLLKTKVKGVFLVIDDDKDEHELMRMAIGELGLKNKVRCFFDGQRAYDFLMETNDRIFLVMSDINMPKMDGLQLKRLIDLTPQIRIKAIPFFFHSNSATQAEVRAAYALGIQGYIKKALTLQETKSSLEKIIALWTDMVHPKDFN